MYGLTLVAKEFNMSYKEIAETIGVTPQTLNDWIKGKRKIPQLRLEQLVELFKLDEKYFLKEENHFTEVERLEIRLQYLKNTNKLIEDLEVSEYRFWSNQNEINRLTNIIENKRLLLRLEQLISKVGRIGEYDYNKDSTENYFLLEKIEYVLRNENDNKDLVEKLRSLFKKIKLEN